MTDLVNQTPYEILARYERRSLAHASEAQDELDAPGLWRGIGFRVGARLLVTAGLAFATLEAASAFIPSYTMFMLVLIPIGGAGILLATSCNSTLQLNSAPHMQGRVMALYTTVFVGCAPLGSLLVGWLGGLFGPRWALFFGGGISLVAVLACAVYYSRVQQIKLRAGYLWRQRVPGPAEVADEMLVADVRSR